MSPSRSRPSSRRARRRAALGDAAVVSLNEAIDRLPIRDSEARVWLQDAGLVRLIRGRPVVHWGSVLRALGADSS